MTGRLCLLFGFLLVLLLAAAGCTTLSVGNVSYSTGNLSVTIASSGTPVNTGVQVRVFKLDEFEQHELLTTGTMVMLTGPVNTVAIPLHLDPGRYKIYVYITTNGQREAAVIRDIAV
ncbi:MAG: hypothetical protein ABSG28_08875 [Methanoregula sp.]|jgi:hypothetical protein|uniref:hypothetical protein n=1 Tax=Methanoregula sp. TaxID=2052170 RepID=UPI003C1F051B